VQKSTIDREQDLPFALSSLQKSTHQLEYWHLLSRSKYEESHHVRLRASCDVLPLAMSEWFREFTEETAAPLAKVMPLQSEKHSSAMQGKRRLPKHRNAFQRAKAFKTGRGI
jgi:hypothetical protein